jgi:hypothetical protein
MLFAIDSDQTIATGFVGATLQESINHYQELGVTLPDPISDYQHLFQLPEVIKLHQEVPGSVVGVSILATHGTVSYYQVGRSTQTVEEQHCHAAMIRWLRARHFPCPSNLVACASVADQLIRLYYYRTQDMIVLIDNNVSLTLATFAQFVAGKHTAMERDIQQEIADDLRQRLVVVAFGIEADALPKDAHGVRLLALPGWNMGTALLTALGVSQDRLS